MSKRHFDNFLDGYMAYARNQYAPEQFTLWTGISIVAAALERKVWIPEGNFCNYPNLFVLLTAGPGVGKTSAIRQGVSILYGMQERNPNFKIVEGVSSAAGLREIMKQLDNMPDGINQFSSVLMVGKEGSESALKNHGDDFRSAACAMYDCEERYQFTLKDGQMMIPQPVMNMLVGTTFDFLGSVVDQNSVFGGLASRFTYILEKDSEMKGEFFQGVKFFDEEKKKEAEAAEAALSKIGFGHSEETKQKLIDDLYSIHKMYGAYRIKKEVMLIVRNWFEAFKKEFNETESERTKAMMIRKRTLLKKLLIIIAASRSNELVITSDHALEAIGLVDAATKDNPYIMSQALIANTDSQGGLNELIIQAIKKSGGSLHMSGLKRIIYANGNDVSKVAPTLELLIGSGIVTHDLKTGILHESLDIK
jgi:hypothetical protein